MKYTVTLPAGSKPPERTLVELGRFVSGQSRELDLTDDQLRSCLARGFEVQDAKGATLQPPKGKTWRQALETWHGEEKADPRQTVSAKLAAHLSQSPAPKPKGKE